VTISQVVPQLGGVKQRLGGKTVFVHTWLSRAYLALAKLSCFSGGREGPGARSPSQTRA